MRLGQNIKILVFLKNPHCKPHESQKSLKCQKNCISPFIAQFFYMAAIFKFLVFDHSFEGFALTQTKLKRICPIATVISAAFVMILYILNTRILVYSGEKP